MCWCGLGCGLPYTPLSLVQSCRNSLAQFEQRYQDLEAQDRELRGEDAKLRSEKGDLRKIVDTHKSHRANITSRESK